MTEQDWKGFNEARAVSPGKFARGPQMPEDARVASMRPGPFRPGNMSFLAMAGFEVSASMRPGPFRPGNLAALFVRLALGCFNEARAVSPGKFVETVLPRGNACRLQ